MLKAGAKSGSIACLAQLGDARGNGVTSVAYSRLLLLGRKYASDAKASKRGDESGLSRLLPRLIYGLSSVGGVWRSCAWALMTVRAQMAKAARNDRRYGLVISSSSAHRHAR